MTSACCPLIQKVLGQLVTSSLEELNNVLGGELSISYREIECGCNLFYVDDEQGFFPEECCVSSSGEPFEDACEDVFDSCQDAIARVV